MTLASGARTGAVTLNQRYGSALNLNIHLHMLFLDGAYAFSGKRAQEFIEEYYYGAVCIQDLCRVTGVGVRTLQRNFREYFGLTISEYLKTVRLDAARRELAIAHASQVSVAEIALRHGFNHLGRFSIQFHERFEDSPRETLAMRAGRG